MSIWTDVQGAFRRPLPRIPLRVVAFLATTTVLVVAVVVFRQPLTRFVGNILPNPAPQVVVNPPAVIVVPSQIPTLTAFPSPTETMTLTPTPTPTLTPTLTATATPIPMFSWAEQEFASSMEASEKVRVVCNWQAYSSFPIPALGDFALEAKKYLESNAPAVMPGRGLPGNITSLENNGERCIYYIAAVEKNLEFGLVVFEGKDNQFHIFSFSVPPGSEGYFFMALP